MRGATSFRAAESNNQHHFNPRTPCGVRPQHRSFPRSAHPNFNPRTPCGVRLTLGSGKFHIVGFQSTHPVRGATPCQFVPALASAHFNPRTPCGVRLQTCTTWFASVFATSPNRMYACFHYTCFNLQFQPKMRPQSHSAVRSAPNIHVCFRFAPCQSISNPSGA